MNSLVQLIYLSPLFGALIILCGVSARKTAIIASSIAFASTLIVFLAYNRATGGYQFFAALPLVSDWDLKFSIGIDGLSATLLLLTSIVGFAAVWVSPRLEEGENWYYACILLIAAGAAGAFASLDLFFFYAFHELALIPTFLMIGIWGSGNRQSAAWKITIYLSVGSFILLIGLILLYQSLPPGARSFDLRGLQSVIAANKIAPDTQRDIYVLLLVGFGILISLFPFHSWAPEAYASAPAPAAMLHAGVLKKFGLYGLLRLAIPMLPDGAQYWTQLLVILLLGNIIFIGLVTIAQKELDWMLGYSSVMHMGYIFLGIASANMLGTTGAAALIFAHGLSIALLAYQLSLNGEPAPVIDGLTGVQRVFFGWAQVWRTKSREAEAIRRLAVDPHSPPEFRCNGVIRNIDAFYDAFDVAENDELFLDPQRRVRIWN